LRGGQNGDATGIRTKVAPILWNNKEGITEMPRLVLEKNAKFTIFNQVLGPFSNCPLDGHALQQTNPV
jgi:hypothetical protein